MTVIKNTFSVTADFSSQFPMGTALKTPDQISAYFRALFSFGKEPPLTLALDDDQLLAVVDYIETGDDPAAADVARLDALEKAVNVLPSISAIGNTVKASGMAFGNLLSASFDAIMETGLRAKRDTDSLPMAVAFEIDKVLPRGGNGQITAPFPGTPETETIKDANGHETVIKYENPDRFVIKTGSTREVSSYYAEAFKLRPAGRRIMDTLAQIEGTTDALPSIVHPEYGETTTTAEFKAMRAKDRTAAKATWKARFDYGVGKLRRGALICFQVQAISAMDRIEITLASKPEAGAPQIKLSSTEVLEAGRVFKADSTKPIMLMDARVKGSMTDPMSVTSFLALDPSAVPANATLEKLLETGEREAKTPAAGTAKVASLTAGDFNGWFNYLAETTAWFVDPANFQMILVAASNNKLDAGVVASMHDLARALDSINGKTQRIYDDFETKRQAEHEAAELERKAKLTRTG